MHTLFYSLFSLSSRTKKERKKLGEHFLLSLTHTIKNASMLLRKYWHFIFRDWIALKIPHSTVSFRLPSLSLSLSLTRTWELSFFLLPLYTQHRTLVAVSVWVKFIRWKHKICFYVLRLPCHRPIKRENVNLNSK